MLQPYLSLLTRSVQQQVWEGQHFITLCSFQLEKIQHLFNASHLKYYFLMIRFNTFAYLYTANEAVTTEK